LERVAAFAQVNNLSWFEPILQNKEKTQVRVHSVVTSTTEGEGVDVFTPFSLFVCLFVFLCTGYLKKLWTALDEMSWTGSVCDKDKLIRFW